MIDSLLDTIFDRTVIAGYTNVGYRLRRGTWNPRDLQPMNGKVVLVTGATVGLGLDAAEGFASLGAAVRLLARSAERGERGRETVVARSCNSDVQVELCDLSDLDAVRQFAERFSAHTSRVDVLVNNAGARLGERTLSVDGRRHDRTTARPGREQPEAIRRARWPATRQASTPRVRPTRRSAT